MYAGTDRPSPLHGKLTGRSFLWILAIACHGKLVNSRCEAGVGPSAIDLLRRPVHSLDESGNLSPAATSCLRIRGGGERGSDVFGRRRLVKGKRRPGGSSADASSDTFLGIPSSELTGASEASNTGAQSFFPNTGGSAPAFGQPMFSFGAPTGAGAGAAGTPAQFSSQPASQAAPSRSPFAPAFSSSQPCAPGLFAFGQAQLPPGGGGPFGQPMGAQAQGPLFGGSMFGAGAMNASGMPALSPFLALPGGSASAGMQGMRIPVPCTLSPWSCDCIRSCFAHHSTTRLPDCRQRE